MSVGLFDFHDHSADLNSNLNENIKERFVNLCFNRFKTCQINPSAHKYILNTEIEDSKLKFIKMNNTT